MNNWNGFQLWGETAKYAASVHYDFKILESLNLNILGYTYAGFTEGWAAADPYPFAELAGAFASLGFAGMSYGSIPFISNLITIGEMVQLLPLPQQLGVTYTETLHLARTIQFFETTRYLEAYFENLPYNPIEFRSLYFTLSDSAINVFDTDKNLLATMDLQTSKVRYYSVRMHRARYLKEFVYTTYIRIRRSYLGKKIFGYHYLIPHREVKRWTPSELVKIKREEMERHGYDTNDENVWNNYKMKVIHMFNPYAIKWGNTQFLIRHNTSFNKKHVPFRSRFSQIDRLRKDRIMKKHLNRYEEINTDIQVFWTNTYRQVAEKAQILQAVSSRNHRKQYLPDRLLKKALLRFKLFFKPRFAEQFYLQRRHGHYFAGMLRSMGVRKKNHIAFHIFKKHLHKTQLDMIRLIKSSALGLRRMGFHYYPGNYKFLKIPGLTRPFKYFRWKKKDMFKFRKSKKRMKVSTRLTKKYVNRFKFGYRMIQYLRYTIINQLKRAPWLNFKRTYRARMKLALRDSKINYDFISHAGRIRLRKFYPFKLISRYKSMGKQRAYIKYGLRHSESSRWYIINYTLKHLYRRKRKYPKAEFKKFIKQILYFQKNNLPIFYQGLTMQGFSKKRHRLKMYDLNQMLSYSNVIAAYWQEFCENGHPISIYKGVRINYRKAKSIMNYFAGKAEYSETDPVRHLIGKKYSKMMMKSIARVMKLKSMEFYTNKTDPVVWNYKHRKQLFRLKTLLQTFVPGMIENQFEPFLYLTKIKPNPLGGIVDLRRLLLEFSIFDQRNPNFAAWYQNTSILTPYENHLDTNQRYQEPENYISLDPNINWNDVILQQLYTNNFHQFSDWVKFLLNSEIVFDPTRQNKPFNYLTIADNDTRELFVYKMDPSFIDAMLDTPEVMARLIQPQIEGLQVGEQSSVELDPAVIISPLDHPMFVVEPDLCITFDFSAAANAICITRELDPAERLDNINYALSFEKQPPLLEELSIDSIRPLFDGCLLDIEKIRSNLHTPFSYDMTERGRKFDLEFTIMGPHYQHITREVAFDGRIFPSFRLTIEGRPPLDWPIYFNSEYVHRFYEAARNPNISARLLKKLIGYNWVQVANVGNLDNWYCIRQLYHLEATLYNMNGFISQAVAHGIPQTFSPFTKQHWDHFVATYEELEAARSFAKTSIEELQELIIVRDPMFLNYIHAANIQGCRLEELIVKLALWENRQTTMSAGSKRAWTAHVHPFFSYHSMRSPAVLNQCSGPTFLWEKIKRSM